MSTQHIVNRTNENKYINLAKAQVCIYCNSKEVIKKGFRKTSLRGKQQRYFCNSCKKSFIIDKGFSKMKNKENIITMAIDFYFSNFSSREVSKKLYAYLGIKVNHITILNWVRKYSKITSKYLNNLKLNLSGAYYIDETLVSCKKNYYRFWCALDNNSKFIVASHYSKERNLKESNKFMNKIKARGKTTFLQSDGAGIYPHSIVQSFGWRKNTKIEHKIINAQKTGKFNIPIERFFRNLRLRLKVLYSFKNKESAEIILNGFVVWYNAVRKHMKLGTTPLEYLTGMDLGDNKLLSLIYLSS